MRLMQPGESLEGLKSEMERSGQVQRVFRRSRRLGS